MWGKRKRKNGAFAHGRGVGKTPGMVSMAECGAGLTATAVHFCFV